VEAADGSEAGPPEPPGTLDIRGFSTRRRQLLGGAPVELVTATREQTAISP
jgi:hypothetical protein